MNYTLVVRAPDYDRVDDYIAARFGRDMLNNYTTHPSPFLGNWIVRLTIDGYPAMTEGQLNHEMNRVDSQLIWWTRREQM